MERILGRNQLGRNNKFWIILIVQGKKKVSILKNLHVSKSGGFFKMYVSGQKLKVGKVVPFYISWYFYKKVYQR
jgi:hypothetical protein